MKIPLIVSFVSTLSLACSPLWADFTYDQTTQITGGGLLQMVKFAGAFSKNTKKLTEPMPETVSIKGNRMVRKSADSATIMDLDQKTITSINLADKTYSVITFEQMKQQMAEAMEKMHNSSKSGGQSPDVQFDIKVNDTGKTKQVLGNDTHELVTTMIMSGTDAKSGASGAMNMLSDMWIAPKVSGYAEVREFHRHLAEALGSVPGDNPLLNRPDIAQAMARMYKDASKFDGIPLVTVTKVGISADAAANPTAATQDSGNQPTTTADSSPKSSSSAQGEAAAALAQAFGGRFGLGKRKKQDSNNSSQSSSGTADSSQASGSLLEMTSQVNSYNSDTVDASVFNIPAGFKQVEAKMPNAGNRR